MSEQNNKPAFRAVSIKREGKKEYFFDIGAAWPTKTGGFAIRLNALPIGDTIILVAPKDKAEAAE